MHCRGFVFGHIEVELDERAYDLHNFYSLDIFKYEINARRITLEFSKRSEQWVPPEEPNKICFIFSRVSHFSAQERDPEVPYTEDDCIESIGAVGPEALTKDFYLADDLPPDHHLVLRFQSGLIIRLQAEEASCELCFA
jgi:hypothetical protein